MSKITELDAAEPLSISLDLGDVDLATVPTLKGTALEAVIKELHEDVTWEARHHSHHSYRTHGTTTW